MRRIIYMLCFTLLCLIDQRVKTCSGLDGWLETFRDSMGIVVAVLIMTHYRIDDFQRKKVVYWVWNIAGIIGGGLFLRFGEPLVYYWNNRLAIAVSVLLFGNVVIHTFVDVVIDKKSPWIHKKIALLWLIMMALMIVSRSSYLWPLTHLIMFGCFYLTDFTEEEQTDLFQGILDGLVLAFFLMQGWCFVFRPYDVVRYVGVYSNSNLNGFFYLEVLVAVFAKIVYLTKKGANRWLTLCYWLGAGVLYAFLFLSIGRMAWITSFVLGIIFLGTLKKIRQKSFVKNGLALILCFLLMFPAVFGAVRYLPPVFHHPVWFFGEWSEEKVHSWDAWNSDKFIDLDEFFAGAVGRIAESVRDILEHSPLKITVSAATPEERYQEMLEQGYALPDDKAEDSLAIRGAIYKYYIKHLNWFGHPYAEQGFQLFPWYWIGHAHDIYLQYGTDFGFPVMVIFVVLTVWSLQVLFRDLGRTGSEKKFAYALFFLVTVLFGLVECSWGVGSIGVTMMFVAWREVICNNGE